MVGCLSGGSPRLIGGRPGQSAPSEAADTDGVDVACTEDAEGTLPTLANVWSTMR